MKFLVELVESNKYLSNKDMSVCVLLLVPKQMHRCKSTHMYKSRHLLRPSSVCWNCCRGKLQTLRKGWTNPPVFITVCEGVSVRKFHLVQLRAPLSPCPPLMPHLHFQRRRNMWLCRNGVLFYWENNKVCRDITMDHPLLEHIFVSLGVNVGDFILWHVSTEVTLVRAT